MKTRVPVGLETAGQAARLARAPWKPAHLVIVAAVVVEAGCGGATAEEAVEGSRNDEPTSSGGAGGSVVDEASGGTGAGWTSGADPHCVWWEAAANEAVACVGAVVPIDGAAGMGGLGGAPAYGGALALFTPLGAITAASFYYDRGCITGEYGYGYFSTDEVQARSNASFTVRVFNARSECEPYGDPIEMVTSSDGSAVRVEAASPWDESGRPIVIAVTPTYAGQSIRFELFDEW